jgi:hypothetical protein
MLPTPGSKISRMVLFTFWKLFEATVYIEQDFLVVAIARRITTDSYGI